VRAKSLSRSSRLTEHRRFLGSVSDEAKTRKLYEADEARVARKVQEEEARR
jgi:hypothetical protein